VIARLLVRVMDSHPNTWRRNWHRAGISEFSRQRTASMTEVTQRTFGSAKGPNSRRGAGDRYGWVTFT